MTDLVGHFLIFGIVAVLFLALPLAIGLFVRPKLPTLEKEAIYECGEPTIGSSYIQFDLRFYVVALLFIIFDVEVAFFFPWALIYGGATQLVDPRLAARRPERPSAPSSSTCRLRSRCSRSRPRQRYHLASFEPRRYSGLFRRAAGRLRLRLEAGRPGLGAGRLTQDRVRRPRSSRRSAPSRPGRPVPQTVG